MAPEIHLPAIQPPSPRFALTALWIETLFYGAYIALFCICIHILYRRKRVVFLITTATMFSLSSAHVTLHIIHAEHNSPGLDRATFIISLINNVAADMLVIFRCYIVWGKLKRIIVLPTLLVLLSAVLSYISDTPTILLASLIRTLVVSGLTAGRICWISYQARQILSKRIIRTYNTAVATILESGAIYCLSLMLCWIVSLCTPASEIMLGALAQIVGIVPTLIIIRVGLGRSIDSVESLNGPITFNHGLDASQRSCYDAGGQINGIFGLHLYINGSSDTRIIVSSSSSNFDQVLHLSTYLPQFTECNERRSSQWLRRVHPSDASDH